MLKKLDFFSQEKNLILASEQGWTRFNEVVGERKMIFHLMQLAFLDQ